MKNLLYILLFVPLALFGQTIISIEQDIPLELAQGWNMFGYSCYEPMDITDAFSLIEDKVLIVKDNFGDAYLPEYGFNGIGDLITNQGYQIKTTEEITDFQFCPFLVPVVEGCMDETAFNYNPSANMGDGSCYPFIYGCIDPSAFNYNDYDFDGQANYFTGLNGIDINTDDGSCFAVILGCLDIGAYNYNDYDGDGVANELTGMNGVDVNTDDDSCVPFIYGCTDETAYNYNPEANTDDGSCIEVVLGCTGPDHCNYNPEANTDDGSCEYAELGYDCEGNITEYFVGMEAEGGIVFYIDETGQHGLVAALEDIGQFEWGCYGENVNGAQGQAIGTGYQNTLDIVAQNCQTENGGITAAQAALDAEVNGYSDWYLPSIFELIEMYNTIGNGGPEGNIGGFANNSPWYWSSSEYDSLSAWNVDFDNGHPDFNYKYYLSRLVRVIRAFGYTLGCMDETACNFNSEANMADGSCEYADEVYDCDGNITAEIGDVIEGGYLFYIDETGQHGLVAALEDLTDGATDPYGWGFNGYEWGCYGQGVNGADGQAIGTGYQNTLDIVAQNCQTENGGVTAAQAALDTEINGYSDWYLPSKGELQEMYYTIGNGGPEGNIGGFTEDGNWSSSEYSNLSAWFVGFSNGYSSFNYKDGTARVRVIRNF